jgi:SPP1 family predicted phage head-tail adaptor
MRAGRLRHRITLQQLVAGSPQQKATGEPDESWVDYLETWASVEPLSGRELFAAQEHHSEITTRIRVRYRAGITAKMRVVFGQGIYNIHAILNREMRNIELELLCSQGMNDG